MDHLRSKFAEVLDSLVDILHLQDHRATSTVGARARKQRVDYRKWEHLEPQLGHGNACGPVEDGHDKAAHFQRLQRTFELGGTGPQSSRCALFANLTR
eukprot:scaffold1484_cov241-Pinguiococcus_pyrenoidosus.AAC.9